jgi:serine protease Do
LENAKGALVVATMKGGPAERAGIAKEDFIVAYQGRPVADAARLQNDVAMTPIRSLAKVTVLRGGKRQDFTVAVGDMNEAAKALSAEAGRRLGGSFRNPTEQEIEKLGLDEKAGAVIASVEPNGPLSQAGFEQGDVILQIDGQTVGGADSLAELIAALSPGQQIGVLAADLNKGVAGTVKMKVR